MKSRHFVLILVIAFILSLIPMYVIGNYNHPSVDDYYYGVETAAKYKETGSISQVITTSFDEMQKTYNDWQGNFAAIFLMRLQPAVFGEANYVWSSVILITTFVIAMLLFFYNLLRKWFGAGKQASIAATICITFCAIQFTHTPSDSFYWFNGSIYYTFFFSLMLILFTLITIIAKGGKISGKIISIFFAIPLAFIIGGGNYATALFTCLVILSVIILLIVKKDKAFIPVIFIFLAVAAGLIISIIAPGNAIRQESVGGSNGVLKALVYSFAYGGYNLASSTTAPVIVLWIVLIPLFYRIAMRSSFEFKKPLLVLIFTFCLFCAQGTPVFYAQGLKMPYRMMNIIYFSYYIFMTFNLIYLCGYIGRKYGNSFVLCKFARLYEKGATRVNYIMICIILFVISCVGICKVDGGEDGNAAFSGMPLSVSATNSLINGDAKKYDEECTARNEFLKTTEEQNVVVAPLTVKPEVIFHTDITTDPVNWRNQHMALYYNKNSIRLDNMTD